MCVGSCNIEVPPSPKLHDQLMMLPVFAIDASVKWVNCPLHTVSKVKLDFGAGLIITALIMVSWHPQCEPHLHRNGIATFSAVDGDHE